RRCSSVSTSAACGSWACSFIGRHLRRSGPSTPTVFRDRSQIFGLRMASAGENHLNFPLAAALQKGALMRSSRLVPALALLAAACSSKESGDLQTDQTETALVAYRSCSALET